MAQQDVRYYLNGLLLETDGKTLRAVATDGHRLALCEAELETKAKTNQQVILPRKGVLELQRILGGDGNVDLAIGTNHVRAQIGDIRFTSKLIDGRFPEYGRVIPANPTKQVEADREGLRQALQRTAILSNEKYRGVRINLKSDLVTIQAHNPEQEEAEDQVEVTYKGDEVEIGFNVTYLLDALGGGGFRKGRTWASRTATAAAWCARLARRTRSTSSCRCGSDRRLDSRSSDVPRRAADREPALHRIRGAAVRRRAQSHRRRERRRQDLHPRGHLSAGTRAVVPDPQQRTADPPPAAEAHRIRPYGRCATPARRNRNRRGRRHARPDQRRERAVAARAIRSVFRFRPSIRKSTSWSTRDPERRRRWLDWLVFHVEPSFGVHWARYNRALKQRNAALRIAASEIDAWDAELIRNGEAITEARQRALDRLLPSPGGDVQALWRISM